MIDAEKQKRLQQQWAVSDEEEKAKAFRQLLSSTGGRRFVWWLLEIGGVGQQPFTGNAEKTAFNCGELNVGLQIFHSLLATSPQAYLTMSREFTDERATRAAQLNASSSGSDSAEGFDSAE